MRDADSLAFAGKVECTRGQEAAECGDEGFMLLAALVLIFLLLLALSVAAPRMARSIQRDREQESARRAQQYVRAVRVFYNKNGKRYPGSIEQLEKTNNIRFLRQRYVDPLTGKDDWRMIHVGENQTKVKGFFGEELPGLPTGLGSAAGLQSTTGGLGGAAQGSNNNAIGAGAGGLGGNPVGGSGATGGFGQSNIGQSSSGVGSGPGIGSSSTGGTSGIASQDATSFKGSGGGQIIGVGSNRSGEAILVVNEQTTYETWEFLYDPRIEQLYAKSTLLGGISSGPGTSSGFPPPPGSTLPPPPGATPGPGQTGTPQPR